MAQAKKKFPIGSMVYIGGLYNDNMINETWASDLCIHATPDKILKHSKECITFKHCYVPKNHYDILFKTKHELMQYYFRLYRDLVRKKEDELNILRNICDKLAHEIVV